MRDREAGSKGDVLLPVSSSERNSVIQMPGARLQRDDSDL